MPSNDERREVAARLRKAEIDNLGLTYSAHLGESIGECVRLVSGHECLVESGLNRLAELVEPEPERTCRIVGMDCAGNPPYNKSGLRLNSTACGCSECGYPFNWCRSLIQARNEVVACPNCGAKVIE